MNKSISTFNFFFYIYQCSQMNDYKNQIGKTMKLRELLDIAEVIGNHQAKLLKLAEKEVGDLSISEMAFIKMVSSGSITTMKKSGATNGRILMTEKKVALSKEEKVKRYLKSLSQSDLTALLDDVK